MTDRSTKVETEQSNKPARAAAAVILAAGKSTRMKTEVPKVMHDICGRPMLAYVIDACREAGISQFHVVVGFGKEMIIEAFKGVPGVNFVEQHEQKGTGHAVSMCADALKGFDGDVVTIAGDMPMIRAATLRELLGNHAAAGAKASIATTVLDDPSGYGRIVRDAKGAFVEIVEHRDCTPKQREIHEVNPSYYCFDCKTLFETLPKIKPNNVKGEYYITDALSIILGAGHTVCAKTNVPAEDAVGINSRRDLADVSKVMQRRIQNELMAQGVTIVSPDNTWIDSRATIGAESVIEPFSYIEGHARIGANCRVGPYAMVSDGAVVADGAIVGPGLLTAFDAAPGRRQANDPEARQNVEAARRPPVQTRCS